MGRRLIKEHRILLGFLQFLAQRMAEKMEQKEVKTSIHFCCQCNGLRPLSHNISCHAEKKKRLRERNVNVMDVLADSERGVRATSNDSKKAWPFCYILAPWWQRWREGHREFNREVYSENEQHHLLTSDLLIHCPCFPRINTCKCK